MDLDFSIWGGFVCGALAGGFARFGRVCSMSAIEDALLGNDLRGAKAWGLAIAVAGMLTMALAALGAIELETASVLAPRVHLLGTVLGGLLFGLGMTYVGTCSFGLLIRAGGGDLRAFTSAILVGIVAFAFTAGLLAPVRELLIGFGIVDFSAIGAPTLPAILSPATGEAAATVIPASLLILLGAAAFTDPRMRQRPRLLVGACGLGLAVALGWLVTTMAVSRMTATRVESLTFVAPAGRALLQFMTHSFRGASFGIAALVGTVLASFAVALWKKELRWEAFDDPIEMRRHFMGATLMGLGGVLAHGCTVGQGITAASALAITAPVFIAAAVAGAYVGLKSLIEGRSLWRLGFSTRPD